MSFQSIIEQIKDHPLSSVIGAYISISKKGANYEAICPFHSDTKPSLKISNSKKLYKCFACDSSGDHIKFVQEFQQLEFIEALKETAKLLGIPTDELDKDRKKSPKEEMAFRVLTAASKLYRKYAKENFSDTYEEFLKNRGLDEHTATDFQIGYAPKSNVLLNYFRSVGNPQDKEFAIKVALDIGIIKQGNSGPYDTFRDRIMFPVWDQFGTCRGFSSRAIRKDQVPKYLNSHESDTFNKRFILYGFNLAKNHIREKDCVLVTEGNMDTVALHQFGFKNSVALMGIAISEFSIKKLTSLTKNIVLSLDNDDAGYKAAQRINKQFMEAGIIAKYINFDDQKDPDDYLQTYGRVMLQEKIDNAKSFLDFELGNCIPDSIPESPDQKLSILKDKIFPILFPLETSLLATERLIISAKSLGLQSDPAFILEAYKTELEKAKKSPRREAPTDTASQALSEQEVQKSQIRQQILAQKPKTLLKSEKKLIEEFIKHPALADSENAAALLDLVSQNEVKRLVQWLNNLYFEIDESEYTKQVQNSLNLSDFSSEIKEIVSSSLYSFEGLELTDKQVERVLSDLNLSLQRDGLKFERGKLIELQKNCVSIEESNDLLTQLNEIQKKLEELKK
jgi:DNA primase